ncbi:hypothetical protein MLD38_020518 [Melastoma candidum]|uniref:Uncharacterized protein n=1 Tax=Melastoma candidum TaxID=119954 RepID=A0ACB9QDJ2_9MYRT|nr:hypothetical protein MLD38_020518 [Melastoma candidum]
MALFRNLSCSLLLAFVIGAAVISQTVYAAPVCTGLDKQCGDSIFTYIVKTGGPPPTDFCCGELRKFGRACHDQFVEINVKAKSYTGTLQEFLKRGDDLWNKCSGVSTIIGTPSPVSAPSPI